MPKSQPPHLSPEAARYAEALVKTGRFPSVDAVLAASVEAVQKSDAEATERDDVVWADFVARKPSDPRDMTAAEVVSCLNSDDPARRDALRAHIEALQADLDAGKGIRTTPHDLMAGIRAELGLAPR